MSASVLGWAVCGAVVCAGWLAGLRFAVAAWLRGRVGSARGATGARIAWVAAPLALAASRGAIPVIALLLGFSAARVALLAAVSVR